MDDDMYSDDRDEETRESAVYSHVGGTDMRHVEPNVVHMGFLPGVIEDSVPRQTPEEMGDIGIHERAIEKRRTLQGQVVARLFANGDVCLSTFIVRVNKLFGCNFRIGGDVEKLPILRGRKMVSKSLFIEFYNHFGPIRHEDCIFSTTSLPRKSACVYGPKMSELVALFSAPYFVYDISYEDYKNMLVKEKKWRTVHVRMSGSLPNLAKGDVGGQPAIVIGFRDPKPCRLSVPLNEWKYHRVNGLYKGEHEGKAPVYFRTIQEAVHSFSEAQGIPLAKTPEEESAIIKATMAMMI